MYNKESLAVVWLKRDLRLQDNEAIQNAINTGKRVLLLFVFEEFLLKDPHYDKRHWDFIKESIRDLNKLLLPYNSKVLAVNSEVAATLNQLHQHYTIRDLFSHQETGLLCTYHRDLKIKRYCHNNLISWKENIWNGVLRGIQNRKGWIGQWKEYMESPQFSFHPKNQLLTLHEIEELEKQFSSTDLATPENSPIQKGGVTEGLRYQNSFFKERYLSYTKGISKSELSRESCSRLSPYLAWGNLSTRQVWQAAKAIRPLSKNKKDLDAFTAKLKWQAHFIQKFEMEHTMEDSSMNKGYQMLKKNISIKYQKAWEQGQTGVPMIDACMRCMNETGYLNFRMRAMIVSFFTHLLWQPWQDCAVYLSKMFIDFEPGIHFAQVQMQAGETGVNTLRIYNPIKNGYELDTNADFIRKWVPELAHLQTKHIHEPYSMTPLEQGLYNLKLGIDYPHPIIDLKANRQRASKILWEMKNDPIVMQENNRILEKHTLNNTSLNIAG
ncbi:cryptochrome/deoxyribodipyrimidine photo-lyase family protein [Wenyingzhuangia aestuarii]|uniref:cryptochrome/deoxyribodipyrimidine photo-lyase family protein n=1 Tax=Wenyingzhuangia aestuarii TaxID=1647582 RepID=UPI001ADB15FB|nr:FAD-binding domain-containing protein [Wenyingzhuangia aestuarii]NJB82232.1 deoxyribodipyrimidine photo-lyase [Wenyingzhuangia aestuarii]